MTKAKKNIATLVCIMGLICSLLLCCAAEFSTVSATDCILSYRGKLNAGMMADIAAAGQISKLTSTNDTIVDKGEDDFSLSLNKNEDNSYTGTGNILLESGNETYCATGYLKQYILGNGEDAYIGTLSDEIDDGKQILLLTIHAMPNTDKLFALANISIKNGAGDIVENKVYAYGELFDEMNELVSLYNSDNYADEESNYNENSTSEILVSTSDYNTKFIKTTISSYGTSSGGYYDLIALSAFAPNAMKPNGVYTMYAKINANRTNARSYAGKFLTVGVVTGIHVDRGTLSMTAKKTGVGFTSQSPEDKTFNVTIPVPYPSGAGVGVKKFTIPIIKVDAELKQVGNYNSDGTTNCAYWYFGGNNDVCWSSDVAPKDTEKAYAGQGYITNFVNSTSNSTCNVSFSGTVVYGYTSQYGATQYTGSFSTSASLTHSVTLVKTSN